MRGSATVLLSTACYGPFVCTSPHIVCCIAALPVLLQSRSALSGRARVCCLVTVAMTPICTAAFLSTMCAALLDGQVLLGLA